MQKIHEYTMIPVDRLLAAVGNPFEVHQINQNMVREALRFGTYELASEPYCHGSLVSVERDPEWHAQRVAYLVRYGWEHPLEIDVGIPSMNYYPYCLLDGHHRLCAAIIREDEEIRAEISGSVDYAFELFGVDCSLYGKEVAEC